MESSGSRLWVWAVIAVIVVGAIVAGAWSLGDFATKSSPTTAKTPQFVLVLVANGTRLTVRAPGYLLLGPFNLQNYSEWTPTGTFWETNGTDFCLISQGHYDQWNKTSPPTYKNCDGFGMYGDPSIGGWQSIPSDWAIVPGVYDLVWYNLGGVVPVSLNITAAINVTATGQPCDQSPPPVGC